MGAWFTVSCRRRRCVGMVLLVLMLAVSTGCYTYRPVVVEVRDARGERPLEGAVVHTGYREYMSFFHPRRATARTDRDGKAWVEVAQEAPRPYIVVERPGYAPGKTDVMPQELKVSLAPDAP